MITVPEADAILSANPLAPPCCETPLRHARGKALRQDIVADRDFPPFDRVMMDGFALNCATYAEGRREYDVEAVRHAGEPPIALQDPEACVEVMTGAALPAGCDAVVPVEDVTQRNGVVEITAPAVVEPGRFIHRRGSDANAGTVLVRAGARVNGPVAAVCASVGRATVNVARPPRAAVVSTGDEALPVEAQPGEHQIRRSNGPALACLLGDYGIEVVTERHAADDMNALEAAIAEGLEAADALVLTGGVSMGKRDLAPQALEAAGVAPRFHRVAQKPGKPLWFGVRQGAAVFGLPGNPVSALTCARRYVLPYLLDAQGVGAGPAWAHLSGGIAGSSALTRFVPVTTEWSNDGRLLAQPRPVRTSGDVASLAVSAGFVEVPPSEQDVQPGTALAYYPWSP